MHPTVGKMGSFSGKEKEFAEWLLYSFKAFLAMTQAGIVEQLPEDPAEYQQMAEPDPVVWLAVPHGHLRCQRCRVANGGMLFHIEPDVTPAGKERRKNHATDARVGTAVREACKEGTADWLCRISEDEGLASRIIRRLRAFFREFAVRAYERLQRAFSKIRVDLSLPRSRQIDTWMCAVMKVRSEMVRLVRAHPVELLPLSVNERVCVSMIKQHAPARHKKADLWRLAQHAATLMGFFQAMLERDHSDEADDEANEMEPMETIIEENESALSTAMRAQLAEVTDMSQLRALAAKVNATGATDDDLTPGKNGLNKKTGKPVTCWTCDSKDHRKQECPKALKRKLDAGDTPKDGKKAKTKGSIQVCRYYYAGYVHTGNKLSL